MNKTREVLKMVVVGHVDHGKSTVIGRLLYDTKSLPEGAIDRVKRISKEKGKPFEYAYLLDAFEEEQKQGITIDTTQLQFRTEKRDYVIIDAPGHKEFLKNMISGASSAEAALLIIDANEGIQEQSRRHGYILSLLGIENIYVIVNKMDLIDYSEVKFSKIRQEMDSFLRQLGIRALKTIPISAFHGENLTHRSDKMPWYREEPVLEAMDLFEKERGVEELPLRFPVQDVYKFDHRRIIVGRIEAGRLRVGDEILISPGEKLTRVKTIEHWAPRDKTDVVEANMSVGITVEDEFFNKRGECISHRNSPPVTGNVFRANIFWMGKNALLKDKTYKLKLVTQEVECEIQEIHKVVDATTLQILGQADEVKLNDVAEVTIRAKEPICFDLFKKHHSTGRFVLLDGYDVSGGGIVSATEEAKQVEGKFISGNLAMPVHCFDDYFYVLSQQTLRRVEKSRRAYQPGDPVPVSGETYAYPQNFDLLHLESGLVARIRSGILESLLKLGQYSYEGHPVISEQGFKVKISTQADVNQLKIDFTKTDLTAFSNKWFDFHAYRTVRYQAS
jgi:bifunctional enzyme CysN/CysC/sulfate adenylyltransferase subunit 1